MSFVVGSRANNPDEESIFGNTYDGVPNPMVPHRHPWPTRYHGPVLLQPEAVFSYRERPYAVVPFAGVEGEGACCDSCAHGGPCTGCGESPDGLGEAPLFQSLTGNGLFDALLGAAAGYFAAPPDKDRVAHAAAGAGLGAVFGTVGLIGMLGYEIFIMQRDVYGRWRADRRPPGAAR